MKKVLIVLLTVISISFGCLALSSCKPTPPSGSNENTQIMAIYDNYVLNAEEKGETPLSYEDWLAQIKGEKGEDGKSAYQIWLENGNEGTEADFLNWLKGDQGEQGIQGEKGDKGDQGEQGIQGEKGDKGDNGKSAYEIWLENGNQGTEEDFLIWLKGLNDHNFGEWIAFSPADVDCAEKLYYRACSDCSKVDWKQGSFDDHDWSKTYFSDTEYHWRKCALCGAINEKEAHVEGPYDNCIVCNPISPTDGIIYQEYGTYASVVGYEGSSSEVVIADSYNGMPVTNIGWLALGEKESITKVIIPNTVTTIEGRAFNKSTNLTSVVIPDSVITIGEYAFCDCQNLESITIPRNITTIENGAFFCCYNLKSVYINNLANWCNVLCNENTNIFSNVESLYIDNVLTSELTLPDSISSINDYTFDECNALNSVIIPDTVITIGCGAFGFCRNLTSVNIGNGVTLIDVGAFEYCSSLTNLVIGNSVRFIESCAFNMCVSLMSVTIPDSLLAIYSQAFSNCDRLTSVTLGNGIVYLAFDAFDTYTVQYTVYENAKYLGTIDNPYFALVEVEYKDYLSHTIHPDTEFIANYSFRSCDILSITIPDKVKTIGKGAFRNCVSLTSVIIPDSVIFIGDYAFCGCSSLTSATLGKGTTYLSNDTFYDTAVEYTIYENAKYLGTRDNPYFALVSVENKNCSVYTIHPDTEVVAGNAFSNCEQLLSITIPEKVKTINFSAFGGCSNLTNIVIGNSVILIVADAFFNCSSLTSVVIGDSVTSIGIGAFYNCSRLKIVYYKGTAKKWAEISIESNNDKLTSATRYYYVENAEDLPTDGGNYWHYDENGEIAVW